MLTLVLFSLIKMVKNQYSVIYFYNLDINQTTLQLNTILPDDSKYINCQYILTLGNEIQCQSSYLNIFFTQDLDYEFQADCQQNKFTLKGHYCYDNFTLEINNFTGPLYNISINSVLDIYYFDGSQYQFDQQFSSQFSFNVQEYQIQATSSSQKAFDLNDMIFQIDLQKIPILNGSQIKIILPQYNPNMPVSIYDHFEQTLLQCIWIQGQQQIVNCQYNQNVLIISNYLIAMLLKPLNIVQVKISGYRTNYIVSPVPIVVQVIYNIMGITYHGFQLTSSVVISEFRQNLPNTINLSNYGTSATSQINININVSSYFPIKNTLQIQFQENPQFTSQFDLTCVSKCLGFNNMLISNNLIQFQLTEQIYQENVSIQFNILNFINPSTNSQYQIQITVFEQIGNNKFIVNQGQNQITFTQNSLQNVNVNCMQCYFGEYSSYKIQLVTPIISTSSQLLVTFPQQLIVQPQTLAIRITDNYYIQIKQDNQKIQIDGLFLLSNFYVNIDVYDILNPLQQEYDYQFTFELINQNKSIIKSSLYQNITYIQFPMYAVNIILGNMISVSYKTNLIIEIESQNKFLRNETLQIYFSQCYIDIEQSFSCQISNIGDSKCSFDGQILEISLADQIEELNNLQIFISQLTYPRAIGQCTLQFQTKSNNQIIKQSKLYDLQVINLRPFKLAQIYYDGTGYIINLQSSQYFYIGEMVEIKIPEGLNISLINNQQGLEQNQQTLIYLIQNNGTFSCQIKVKILSLQNQFNQIFQAIAYDKYSRITQQSFFQLDIEQITSVQQILFEIKPGSYYFYESTSYHFQLISSPNLLNPNYMVIIWPQNIQAKYFQTDNYNTSSYWIQGRFNLRLNIDQQNFINNEIIVFDKIINPKQSADSWFQFKLQVYDKDNILLAQGEYNLDNTFMCYQNCAICLSQSYCKECQNNFYLYNNQCLQNCPQGYFVINKSCYLCPISKGCKQCNTNTPTICNECQNDYILVNGTCSPLINDQQNKNNNEDINGAFLITYLQIILFIMLAIRKLFRRDIKFLKTFWMIQEFQVIILEKILLVFLLVNSQYQFFFLFISIVIIDQIQMIIGQQVIKKFVQFNLILENQAQRDNVAKLFQLTIYFFNWRIIYILETYIFDRRCFSMNLSQFRGMYNQIQQFTYIYNYIQSPLQLSVLLYILISGYISTFQIDYTVFFISKTILQSIVIIMDKPVENDVQANNRIYPEEQFQ